MLRRTGTGKLEAALEGLWSPDSQQGTDDRKGDRAEIVVLHMQALGNCGISPSLSFPLCTVGLIRLTFWNSIVKLPEMWWGLRTCTLSFDFLFQLRCTPRSPTSQLCEGTGVRNQPCRHREEQVLGLRLADAADMNPGCLVKLK